jgi:tetratricopeptide (TPR) repeat protein
MQHLRYFAPILISFLVSTGQAQLRGGPSSLSSVGNVHIHVVFNNDRDAGPYLLVRLIQGSSSMVVGTTYTNDRGEAQFLGVPVGDYHVEISGDGIQAKTSDIFEVDERKMTQAQYVVVTKTEESGPKPLSAQSTTVSASDLNVPPKARKEVDKANEEMATHNWNKALEHLNKAVALAPQYVTAYNNLGVLYDKMNDIPHEEEALQKAVSVDGHFAPALLNYGKLCLRQKNPVQAETLLQRAASSDPNDAEIVTLLSFAEYMNRHFDAAISNALQAHSSGRDHSAFLHYIAARAYQQENQQQRALAEFEDFLREEPKGPRADQARADVAKIQEAQQRSPQ